MVFRTSSEGMREEARKWKADSEAGVGMLSNDLKECDVRASGGIVTDV
jgi:hypothetical protein